MKKNIGIILSCCLFCSATSFADYDFDDVDTVREQTDALYKTNGGSQAATFNTIGKSMTAWGLGLAAVIALVSVAVHQSTADTTTTTQ
ncbi:MAG: hypothetical protein K2Y01_01045 [Rhabdochlamydiaceae bacterium]|nr:hypothetical protein [Rhabdochlamydiaceae bacterium]